MKIGKRLQHIEAMVTTGYTHIWDCCCDHGLLGASLLSRLAAPFIHFVDIVPELMVELEIRLRRFYPAMASQSSASASPSPALSAWQVHCIDVASLPLSRHDGKQLVIIAGVGGDLMVQLVSAIHGANPDADIDFLLCPVHHQFTLRQQLIRLNFHLQQERLLEENRRFYELLLVSTRIDDMKDQSRVSAVGEQIWQAHSPEQADTASRYLSKTLGHYQRVQRGRETDVQHIIEAYRAVTVQQRY
ncbi:tRNA (adenine(22)-N(1))-methyltransferase [Oceanisphaera arctica]|uniref:SAM-dependent methyltransferase n=1 Tax=Oceanisphaera arctica TaxID=641510 RepID=A0A2P5TQR3_9GAMM|nr:tRNA (adenine(22)-N(1))-methyltransferase TrmK [Oceanisphaera arctica]PPL18051.1 SAM-dependent methyltransferase [Oceanisphaera arctica]GHA09487.1 SAM-dependent methyltransferase [Oceanisphaera arctica]